MTRKQRKPRPRRRPSADQNNAQREEFQSRPHYAVPPVIVTVDRTEAKRAFWEAQKSA